MDNSNTGMLEMVLNIKMLLHGTAMFEHGIIVLTSFFQKNCGRCKYHVIWI